MIGLLGTAARRALLVLGIVAAVKAVGIILLAEALATGIAAVVAGGDGWRRALVVGAVGAVLRAVAVWAARAVAQRANLASKTELRRALAERALRAEGAPVGATALLGTRGLDDLDAFFVTFLPALVTAVVVPLAVGARILFADPVSAVVIALTIPLVPVFMILIGRHSRDAAESAADALLRLSGHLVELVRGLPVLVGLGRAQDQARALDDLGEEYRVRTMKTLRTAFLSSLALELIATISVALVAVVIGIRLVHGDLDLEIGLLVLILAPECYLPFREIGAAYHASEDGLVALTRVRAATSGADTASLLADAPDRTSEPAPLRVKGVSVRYPGRAQAVRDVWFTARAGEATLLDGESGAGKTTLLRVLAGRVGSRPGSAGKPGIEASGVVEGVPQRGIAWVPQHPHAWAATPADELELHAGADRETAGALLDEVGMAGWIDAEIPTLSPGQLRRLAVARALGRVDTGATLLLLDEPTAHLDHESAERVRTAIRRRLPRTTAVVASHDPRTQALCARRVALGRTSRTLARSAADTAPAVGEAGVVEQPSCADDVQRAAGGRGRFATLTRIADFLRVRPAGLAFAILLGVLAAAFSVAQTALSGWLIVRAAEQPPIMFLTVAIVGVRFFGIGRATLRYAERLQLHDVVFRIAGRLRQRLWAVLGGLGLRSTMLRQGPAALDLLVGDVDRVRDELPRVVVPPLVTLGVVAGVVTAAAFLFPVAVLPLLAFAVVVFVVAPIVVVVSDRRAARGEQEARSRVRRGFVGILEAGEDLAVHAVTATPLGALDDDERGATRHARRAAVAQGLGSALVVAAAGLASLATIALAATTGASDGRLLAAFALGALALAEPGTELVAAVQRWSALRLAADRVGDVLDAGAESSGNQAARVASSDPGGMTGRIPGPALALETVTARWPGADAPVLRDIDVRLERGDWLTVTGPSGSGKSTLLAVAMGHLPPDRGAVRAGGTIVEPGLRAVAWCPQEGHLFDSSLRANLVLARDAATRPDDDELRAVLHAVGLGPWLAGLPAGLDTRIGAGGGDLSGGQRQRVAVARTLLAPGDVVLLDEPTAHLDEAGAASLMVELRVALADRAVVCVTHDPLADAPGDLRLTLPTSVHRVPELGVALAPTPEVGATARRPGP